MNKVFLVCIGGASYFLWGVLESIAITSSSTTLILPQPAYFTELAGKHVIVQAGTYTVKGAENALHLLPDGETRSISLTAEPVNVPADVDSPVAIITETPQEGVFIAWLGPGGKGWETSGSYNPVQKRGIKSLTFPGVLTSRHIKHLRSFGKRLADAPAFKQLKNDWIHVVQDIARQKNLRNSANVHEMVMLVMREAVVEQNKDKQYWLKKLQTINAMQKELRHQLQNLAQQSRKMTGGDKANNARELEKLIRAKEQELATAVDDAQLANVELQNNLQKMQQLLQMMSNVSKQLHDTAMAVIQKLK